MGKETFDVLILIGRPASGKSEIIDFLSHTSPESRRGRFHIADLQILDDFPMLWTWFEEDRILSERLGQPRLYTGADGTFRYPYLWHLLIERISLEYAKLVRHQNESLRFPSYWNGPLEGMARCAQAAHGTQPDTVQRQRYRQAAQAQEGQGDGERLNQYQQRAADRPRERKQLDDRRRAAADQRRRDAGRVQQAEEDRRQGERHQGDCPQGQRRTAEQRTARLVPSVQAGHHLDPQADRRAHHRGGGQQPIERLQPFPFGLAGATPRQVVFQKSDLCAVETIVQPLRHHLASLFTTHSSFLLRSSLPMYAGRGGAAI